MMIDPDNPVVQLCLQGMEAEQAGRPAEARARFQQAWDDHGDDYEACIAAHYLARHQSDDQATYRWNLTALQLAGRVESAAVRGFWPSLHLNLAASYEALGDETAARAHLMEAEQGLDVLPDDPYGAVVRRGVGNLRGRLYGDHAAGG